MRLLCLNKAFLKALLDQFFKNNSIKLINDWQLKVTMIVHYHISMKIGTVIFTINCLTKALSIDHLSALSVFCYYCVVLLNNCEVSFLCHFLVSLNFST